MWLALLPFVLGDGAASGVGPSRPGSRVAGRAVRVGKHCGGGGGREGPAGEATLPLRAKRLQGRRGRGQNTPFPNNRERRPAGGPGLGGPGVRGAGQRRDRRCPRTASRQRPPPTPGTPRAAGPTPGRRPSAARLAAVTARALGRAWRAGSGRTAAAEGLDYLGGCWWLGSFPGGRGRQDEEEQGGRGGRSGAEAGGRRPGR